MREIDHRSGPTDFATRTIARLEQVPSIKAWPRHVIDAVMILRFCALCDRARRDPLADLATHFGSVATAHAAIELVEMIKRSWPEPYVANRPCCLAMTEHEATLAGMAVCAARGCRDQFEQHIEGFVRPDRHDQLFDASAMLCARLLGTQPFNS